VGLAVKVSLKLDMTDAHAGILSLKNRFPFAIKRAVKRAATSGRAEMVKLIGADTGLPAKRIRDDIKLVEVGDTGMMLEVQGKRIPLVDFKAKGPEPSRGRGRGVSYTLPGSKGRVDTAFIARMQSGHRGVFVRTGPGRLPIRELFGPSMVRVFEKFLPEGAARANEALATNLRSEINFVLSRR
jgi:hypothetical protein